MTSLELAASHGDDVSITVLDDAARERGMRAVDLLTADVEAYVIGDGYINGSGYGRGYGYGYGYGDDNDNGTGNSSGNGYGNGYGYGYGTGNGTGYGDSDSNGNGDVNGQAISIDGRKP